MSSDPPPPDNPPTSDVAPLGSQQTEAASPPIQLSDGPVQPSEPTQQEILRNALEFTCTVLKSGPKEGAVCPGFEWFALASACANAIGEGHNSIALSPALHAQLTQSPQFSDTNNTLFKSIVQAASSVFSREQAFLEELDKWRLEELRKAKNNLKPALDAEVDKWRENRFNELIAKASKDAEITADLRIAQSRSRAKTRKSAPKSPTPTPRRSESSLGKRILVESSDSEVDMDLSEGSSTSSVPPDVSRTPRAKRNEPPGRPAPEPATSDLSPASVSSLLTQVLQRLDALEKKGPYSFNFHPPTQPAPAPRAGPSAPTAPAPTTAQNIANPPQASHAAFTSVTRNKRKGKNTTSSYASAAATPAAPTQPKTKPDAPTPSSSKPPAPKSTEITVQRPALPSEPKATRRSADGIVAQVQQALKGAKSDIPLLFGRWAAHTNNFVYVFGGNIPFSRIQQVSRFLLGPFPEGILAPVGGWSRILLSGVPTSDDDGNIFSEAALEAALRLNPILENIQFVMPPRWLLRPEEISGRYASLTFSIHDPEGSLTRDILQSPIGVFGARALTRRFESRPPLRQCARCHRLGHTAGDAACQFKRDAVRCHLCGAAHPASEHPTACPKANRHTEHGTCNCPLKCLNCRKTGHHALDISCPDRARYRIPGRNSANPQGPPPHA
jgi:hypothetical protein